MGLSEISKFPLASVDGTFMDTALDFVGLEISFNPKRVRQPIQFAERAAIYVRDRIVL